jgi:hypothetical protein
MYFRDPSDEMPRAGLGVGEIAVLAVCALGVLYLGVFPNGGPFASDAHVLDWARQSVAALLQGTSAAAR